MIMNTALEEGLRDRRVLLIEDEWITAVGLTSAFEGWGAKVVGPAATVRRALDYIATEQILHGAVVDINLRGELAFPVADALEQRGIPYIFATGIGVSTIPARYESVPRCEKPFDPADVARAWQAYISRDARKSPYTESHKENLLIGTLPLSISTELRPHLKRVELPPRTILAAGSNRTVEHCYFLESGVAAVVITDKQHETIQVGMIGREGMTGPSILLGTNRPASQAFMHVGGTGLMIKTDVLARLSETLPPLGRTLRLYAHAFAEQIARTVLATGRYTVEQRLARWLLMLSDRTNSMRLQVTHETTATMLGVRRAGVTIALQKLVKQGCVSSERAAIVILDRDLLIAASRGCYSGAEQPQGPGF